MKERLNAIGIALVVLFVGFWIGWFVNGVRWEGVVDERVDGKVLQEQQENWQGLKNSYVQCQVDLDAQMAQTLDSRERMVRGFGELREMQIQRDTQHRHWLECQDSLITEADKLDIYRNVYAQVDACSTDLYACLMSRNSWEEEADYWEEEAQAYYDAWVSCSDPIVVE